MAYLSTAPSSCRPVPARRVSFLDLLELYRQRRALARLDIAALHDLGLTYKDAQTEAHRLPWDIPAGWNH